MKFLTQETTYNVNFKDVNLNIVFKQPIPIRRTANTISPYRNHFLMK
jgi:hypothetical protein